MAHRPLREPNARRHAASFGLRRHIRRRGQRHCLLAQHPDSLFLHLHIGRFGLSGTCRHVGRPVVQQTGTTRKILHSHADGLRMQRTGRHGYPYDRKSQKPYDYHAGHSDDFMQRTHSGVCSICRGILSPKRLHRHALPLRVRDGYGLVCSMGIQQDLHASV